MIKRDVLKCFVALVAVAAVSALPTAAMAKSEINQSFIGSVAIEGTDPEAWTIFKGKLYLNYSKSVRNQWSQDIPGNIAKGEKNWPKVLDK